MKEVAYIYCQIFIYYYFLLLKWILKNKIVVEHPIACSMPQNNVPQYYTISVYTAQCEKKEKNKNYYNFGLKFLGLLWGLTTKESKLVAKSAQEKQNKIL